MLSHAGPILISLKRAAYFVHPEIQATLGTGRTSYPSDIVPTIVVSAVNNKLSAESIASEVRRYETMDDVFTHDFLTDTIVVQSSTSTSPFQSVLSQNLQVDTSALNWTVNNIEIISHEAGTTPLVNGPYFLKGDTLHQAWRLFPDNLDTFQSTCIPSGVNKLHYEPLNAMSQDGMWRSVAVPSRLYSKPSEQHPLAGKRISVKDNFELTGLRTALSNKAYLATYEASNTTAEIVKTLVEKGAIIVGKTKMCAFATAENPTDQWIDFHCPFNPRGDGYLKPGGSTTGGGAALAAYNWLDYSVGTDTTGSIRSPAAANGLFGLRPTWGAMSTEGTVPNCPIYDTIGLLGRDIENFTDLANALFPKDGPDGSKFPKKILYPTELFPYENPDHQHVVDEWVAALESFLGVKKTEFSLNELWRSSHPEGIEGDTIDEWLGMAGSDPYRYDSWNGFAKFREDHKKKFGSEAYVGPYMQWFWDDGSKISAERVEMAHKKIKIYKQWFHENVLQSDKDTGSNAVLVLPFGDSNPNYRDTPNSVGGPVPAMTQWYMPPMLSIPHLVVPFGQLSYESRVSGKKEYFPAVGTIAGAQGSDKMLLALAKGALSKAGKPLGVDTGSTMFRPKI